MKSFRIPLHLALACVVLAGAAHAERADRTKPMNIESDTLRYDDAKQTSVFTGRVVVTKGSIVMRGAQLDVRQDNAGNQFGVLKAEPGKRAFFRQKRDTRPGAVDEYMEGEADTVRFLQRAELRRYLGTTLNDEMTGVVIVYDNTTSVLTVDGGPAKTMPDGTAPRVRAVLTPRNDEARPAGAAAPAATPAPAAPALRRSSTVGVQK